MPGIVGLITRMPRASAEPQLRRMVQSMLHEPFYTSGTWIDERLGVYAGWIALQGSFSAPMPLRSESGNEVLVFSGEEYCEPGTPQRLKQAGHAVDPEGPSYLVHLAEDSLDFPRELNGRFQGLLIRRASGEALLFNDRYGMQRLYIHEAPDAFYFAAEAKAILAVCPHLRQIDPQGMGDFIACGCTLENRTIYKDISLLPPASSWTFVNGAPARKQEYFRPREWEELAPLNQEEYQQQLQEVFPRVLPRYFNGREKIGMSLTGGLDSRMILAWHPPEPHSLPFYSFGSIYRDCQDVTMARRIARATGQRHEVISAGADFLARFPQYAERTVFLTDGSLEVKRAPDLYVNERARQIAPVRMTGNYGGEVLRGATVFKPVSMMPGLFHHGACEFIANARASYGEIRKGNHLSFSVFRQMPWWLYCSLGLEQTQLSLRTPYLDNELVRLAFRAPRSSLNEAVCLRLIAEGSSTLARKRTDRGAGGSLPRVVADLQKAFLEFTFKAEYAYDYGMPQAVARVDHTLRSLHLERLFLGRHKFYHFRVWYRDTLAGYVREMLLDERALSRPYIDRQALRRAVDDHTRGIRNYTTELHRVLTLEHLHRLFIDAR